MVPVSILRCPQCGGALTLESNSNLVECVNCPLGYPLRGGVPSLVISESVARPIATDAEFDQLVTEAIEAPFTGWDFSWLGARRPPPRTRSVATMNVAQASCSLQ